MPEHPVPSASSGSARRHRVEGGRQKAVKIRFTDDEYDAIAARASEARVSVQRYLVARALARKPAPRTAPAALSAELAGLRRLTGSLANNMNQIARRINAGADPDAGLLAAADSVRRTMNRLDSVLAWIGVPPGGSGVPDPRNANPGARIRQPGPRNGPAASGSSA